MASAIPLDWIKHYVDVLLTYAGKAGPDSKMGQAAILRADHAMDLVKAWKEDQIKAFTEFVQREVAAERERNAALAIHHAVYGDMRETASTFDKGWAEAAFRIAAAIRAQEAGNG